MGDLILKIGDKTVHATLVGNKYELGVLVEGASGNVYFNTAEVEVEKALKKLFG